jgi:hypothetical protein
VERTKLERSASRAKVLALSQAELPGCGAGADSDAQLLDGRDRGVQASLDVQLLLEYDRLESKASEEQPGPEKL